MLAINRNAKEVRHCEHVRAETARPYARITGAEYDIIVCWKCQNESAPFVSKINEIGERLRALASK